MKTLLVALMITTFLFSCDATEESYDPFQNKPQNPGGGSGSGGGGYNYDQNGDPRTTDAPIDGGLSILLVAGAAYGVKKYRGNKTKRKEEIK